MEVAEEIVGSDAEPTAFDEVQASTTPAIEMMRGLAEGAKEREDTSWLPPNFRRDTLKDSAEVLVESYKHAERKVNEEAAARRNLEQIVAQQQFLLDEIQASYPETQSAPQQLFDQELLPPVRPHVGPQQIAEIAHQAVQQKLLEPQAQALVDQAEAIVASQVPGYATDRDRVLEAVQRDPALIAAAAMTGDPREIAGALANIHQSIAGPSPQDLMRTMKIQAQSAVGAGGRTFGMSEAEQRWHEIANASRPTLGL